MPNKLVDIYNHTTGHRGFDYDQVSDLIFIGSNSCCQFGFNKELLAKNVRADISLESERIDAPNGVEFFVWLPTIDHAAPTPDQLALGVQTLDYLVEHKIKTYIHCMNGHGRAPTLYLAYLIHKGRTLDQALAELQAKRPSFHLSDVQLAALNDFAAKL